MAIELVEDPHAPAESINLGYRVGASALMEILIKLRETGVNHVMFNLNLGNRKPEEVLEELAKDVMPVAR